MYFKENLLKQKKASTKCDRKYKINHWNLTLTAPLSSIIHFMTHEHFVIQELYVYICISEQRYINIDEGYSKCRVDAGPETKTYNWRQ